MLFAPYTNCYRDHAPPKLVCTIMSIAIRINMVYTATLTQPSLIESLYHYPIVLKLSNTIRTIKKSIIGTIDHVPYLIFIYTPLIQAYIPKFSCIILAL